MRLTTRFSLLLLLLAVGSASAQSKDDEESVDTSHNSVVEGSANAPSDDEDTVEGSGLPPSQVYTKLTTIVHARPAVPVKATTVAPEVPPKKKDPLPPVIDLDKMEKEQKEKEKEQSVSIAPAIPRITTGRPDTGPLSGMTLALAVLLAVIIILIIVVIVIIVVCRRKHKSDYTPGHQTVN